MIVVDASAAIRWFMPADPGGEVYGLPRTAAALVAPDLFIAEIRSAALRYVRKKELTRDAAMAMVETIDRLMAGYVPLQELREGAWAMALTYDHSPYGCFYIELARSMGSCLITTDGDLIRKFAGSPLAGHIVDLADWRPEQRP